MATPPRPDNTTRKPTETTSATPQKAGSGPNWLMYGLAAIVAILILLFLFGAFDGSDEAIATDPTVEQAPAANETADVPAVVAPETDATTEVTPLDEVTPVDEVTPADTGADMETAVDPATEEGAAETDDQTTVIEVESDAEVEVLDEPAN